ncbi:MAG: biotin--[acetyl-CoA-carboxylase] ligase, partial [Actinomycetota bacterium]
AVLVAEASRRSDVIGREITVRFPSGEVLTGVATRLTPSGALEVDAGGRRRSLLGGEIGELRPA